MVIINHVMVVDDTIIHPIHQTIANIIVISTIPMTEVAVIITVEGVHHLQLPITIMANNVSVIIHHHHPITLIVAIIDRAVQQHHRHVTCHEGIVSRRYFPSIMYYYQVIPRNINSSSSNISNTMCLLDVVPVQRAVLGVVLVGSVHRKSRLAATSENPLASHMRAAKRVPSPSPNPTRHRIVPASFAGLPHRARITCPKNFYWHWKRKMTVVVTVLMKMMPHRPQVLARSIESQTPPPLLLRIKVVPPSAATPFIHPIQ